MAASTNAPKNCLLKVSHASQDDTTVDIIAIHGLGTTSPVTWEARGNQDCGAQRGLVNWLSDDDMLPRVVPSATISTFTWDSDYYSNAPILRIRDVADTLLRKLQDKRDEDNTHSRPIIFIASCFGGLIVTRALEIASTKGSEYKSLVVATSGIIFLGSPLQGTRAGTAAQWRAMLGGILNNSPSQTLLQDLDGHTRVLRDTSEQFLKIISNPPMQTMTMCFWESKKSQLAKAILPIWISKHLTSTEMILVEEDSACFLGRPKQHLDAPHVMMNKFQGPEDENFKLVSGSIKNMVREAKRITVAQREAINIHNEHFMVTRRVNPVFTGREKEIKDLQRSLCPSQSTTLLATWPKIYVIHGLGGAGKSEVALKFAYDNRVEFWGVFWLDASSESSLTRGFIDIAEACGVRDKSLEGARLWLQETLHSWLLVLDNADDPKLDYAFYLPAALKGHVLITSRVRETANLQTAGMDFYESLSEITAVELLLKASKIDLNVYSTHCLDARKIVNLLGCHALAIVQAGASISQGICGFGEYEGIFKSQRERLLRFHPAMARSQYGDVYATFEVSATYLHSRSDQPAKDALKLLKFHAFLNFTNFSETTFEDAWRTSREIPRDLQPGVSAHVSDLSHWHVRHLPDFMRQGPSGQFDKISFRHARSLLASLSIIVVDLPKRMSRMHPITHMWARDRLHNQQELTEAWLGTLAVLCLSIKIPCGQKALWVQLQPHIESITDFIPDECLHHATLELHQCFYRLSYVLHAMRADKSLIEMLQKCFIHADQWWTTGFGHYFQLLYGSSLIDYGDFKKAEQWLEKVVDLRESTSDPAEPSLLGCKHELARAYLANGDPNKAKDQFLELARIDGYLLTSDNPARLASEHELGAVYLVLKENDKAKDLLEHVVDIQKSLSPEHPNRLASEHKLAGIYLACKENERARDLLEQVVRVRETILRPEHTDRLDSGRDLARVYLNLGYIAEAKNMLEKVVDIQAEILKPDHPLHLATKYTLARAYITSGERIKAQTQLEEIVQIRGQLLGPGYPEVIAAGNLVEQYEECLKSDVMDYEDSIQLPTTFRSYKASQGSNSHRSDHYPTTSPHSSPDSFAALFPIQNKRDP